MSSTTGCAVASRVKERLRAPWLGAAEKRPQPNAPMPAPASEGPDPSIGEKPALLGGARDGGADDLKKIKGIGKVNEGRLNSFGIWHFDQIAGWGDEEAEWVDNFLTFPGRIGREDWIGQAKKLAAQKD